MSILAEIRAVTASLNVAEDVRRQLSRTFDPRDLLFEALKAAALSWKEDPFIQKLLQKEYPPNVILVPKHVSPDHYVIQGACFDMIIYDEVVEPSNED
jgi:hypothetical protein